MYRAVALAALRRGVNLEDAREIAFVARLAKITFDFSLRPPKVTLNGEEVGHLLRAGPTTSAASFVAQVPAVRELLVSQQQEIGRSRPNLVTEGRDQGTVVFPHAELKFFMDASAAERARRRAAQLRARGEIVDIAALQREIDQRDMRDSRREIGRLMPADDAIRIDTTSLTQEQVIDRIIQFAREKQGNAKP
jgi:cytidylate kinase